MRAIAIREFGPAEGLELVELPDPFPGHGEVLVAVEAIGVGGVDTKIRSGALAAYGFAAGHVPGGEIAGTVIAAGGDLGEPWIGRRVSAFTGVGGGYVERAVIPAARLVALPDELSSADAVTVGSSGIVAHFALRHAQLAAGEAVLVRGAAGGLGVMTVQLAARAGAAEIAVTTSSPARGAALRALGATRVLERDGGGDQNAFDVIIDVIAGSDLPRFLSRLRPNGRMVAVGIVAGPPPPEFGMELFAAFQQSRSFATFSADTVPEPDRLRVLADLFDAVVRGELRSAVHAMLPLEEAVAAHRRMDAGEVFGRIVLVP